MIVRRCCHYSSSRFLQSQGIGRFGHYNQSENRPFFRLPRFQMCAIFRTLSLAAWKRENAAVVTIFQAKRKYDRMSDDIVYGFFVADDPDSDGKIALSEGDTRDLFVLKWNNPPPGKIIHSLFFQRTSQIFLRSSARTLAECKEIISGESFFIGSKESPLNRLISQV